MDSTSKELQWIVAQIGAREHYGIPRAFHRRRHLKLFFTDAWCRWGARWIVQGPKAFRAFAGRYHRDLPNKRVISFTPSTVLRELRQRSTSDIATAYLRYEQIGADFSSRVRNYLEKLKLDPKRDCFFGFNTGCFETLELLRARGIFTIVDQIDPGRVEEDLVAEESLRWEGWQQATGRIPESYHLRLTNEWKLADSVLVNSKWSMEALVKQGVPREKLIVVPLAYEAEEIPKPREVRKVGPLQVLWLGTVNLRKGIQYLIQAAKLLEHVPIRFTVAGPIQISDVAVRSAPSNMEFVGRVTRNDAAQFYSKADVFVLPTLSDGFAITQLEAMAHGLPVVTTSRCGDVVTDGINGFIVPAFDAENLAAALAKFEADRSVLMEMSREALRTSAQFSLTRQADMIETEVSGRMSAKAASKRA